LRLKKLYGMFAIFVLVLVLAACGSSSESDGGEKDEEEKSDDTSTEKAGTVEIFSWWTGAGEEEGLLALIDLFEEEYPDITVENAAVAGGAGTNAKAVLATRMQGDDPPSTFQVHGGDELNKSW